MTERSLDEWLAHADHVHPVGIDLGLARMRRVAERLDVLPPAPRNFVVAGTNGKGSTCVYLEALLRASGRRVGTTISPHLNRFNERIRIDGEPADDAGICDAFETIESARGDTTLTYFEFGVLAALLVFKRARVDATVLEVGLGGRLDAVNVVDASVCVITSIGIDHVDYLGPDRESIGAEKAGILRCGVPCVYGEAAIPHSILRTAREVDAPLVCRDVDFDARAEGIGWSFEGRGGRSRVSFSDLAQPTVALSNAATALQALLMLDPGAAVPAIVDAAVGARLPGRFERFDHRGVPVIVDVAHNPHGAAFLANQLRASGAAGRTYAVAGFLQDKDAAGIVAALESQVDHWTFVDTYGSRGQTASLAAAKIPATTPRLASTRDFVTTLDALCESLEVGDRVIVLGSFDVAQRARTMLSSRVDDLA